MVQALVQVRILLCVAAYVARLAPVGARRRKRFRLGTNVKFGQVAQRHSILVVLQVPVGVHREDERRVSSERLDDGL